MEQVKLLVEGKADGEGIGQSYIVQRSILVALKTDERIKLIVSQVGQ